MAIDKRSTPTWVKAVIVVVAIAFAAGPAIAALASRTGGGSADDSSGATDAFAQTAQQYVAQTTAQEQALASQPTSYTALVNQGNTYFDWAAKVQQDPALGESGADRPIWLAATGYYARALEVKSDDPSVGTDMAIAHFYGGQTAQAIVAIENVMKGSPDFAAAYFNAGIFYQQAQDNAKALAVLERYVQLEPSQNPGQAQQATKWISELKGASVPTTATGD